MVILFHAAAGVCVNDPVLFHSYDWHVAAFYQAAAIWNVAMFIMVSGMFMLEPKKIGDNFKEEMTIIKNKIFRFIRALIFWLILYNVMYPVLLEIKAIISGEEVNSLSAWMMLKSFIKHAIGGSGGTAWVHLWFLYLLIGLYLLTPLLRRLIQNTKKEHLEYFLILFFASSCLLSYNACNDWIHKIIPSYPNWDIYFPLAKVIGSVVGFYIAGYYFSHYEISKKVFVSIISLALFSFILTTIGTSLITIYTNEWTNFVFRDNANRVLVSFAVFIFVKFIFENTKIPEKAAKWVSYVSSLTFGIYLIHVFILDCVKNLFGFSQLNPIWSLPLLAIITFALSAVCIIVLKKVPMLEKYVL